MGLFAGVLGASNCRYSEVSRTHTSAAWIAPHIRAAERDFRAMMDCNRAELEDIQRQ